MNMVLTNLYALYLCMLRETFLSKSANSTSKQIESALVSVSAVKEWQK